MSEVVIAYVPVLHEGYRRFLDAHSRGRRLFLIGPSLYTDYRPLAKDIRCLDADLTAEAIAAWGICSQVSVLDERGARALAGEEPTITLPAEDISYQVVERYFARCEVRYDSVFLRWDKSRTVQLLRPTVRTQLGAGEDATLAALVAGAEEQANGSVDWWRQVGAAIRFSDGSIATARNEHEPHRLSAYTVGDPRSNFFKGVGLELSTATHAEARLIAQAAREGTSTLGSVVYCTDFPCPPCAKLLAAAGIERLYFRSGYAVLDGQDVLEAAGVELVQVA
ncbi:MAG TPA: deaminase [Solirubrobacteraceae bacterium]|jgi:dCMP deaminase|nr:deaminase [Solirubrobacteraceae bacterium]